MTAPAAPLVTVEPVTQGRVVRAEWIKMRTLRSTVIVLALTVVAIVGIGLLIAAATKSNHPTAASARADGVDPIERVLGGVGIAQLTIGVLGVLSVTGEYSTGMIRATLGAVPKRLPVLWAKLATFAGVVAVVCLVACFAAFFAGQAVLGPIGVSLGSAGALRSVIGAALYVTAVGLLGVAFGFIIRNTAGGIAALFLLLLVLPGLSNLLPTGWQDNVQRYYPSFAGQAVYAQHGEHVLAPWAGFGLFVAYVAVAVLLAAISLRRRDA